MSEKRIEERTVALAELRLDPQNAKIHSEVQIAQVMASIRKFGFADPIGVTPDMMVIEGHARYEAARRLGHTDVPVIVVHGLSDAERRGYAIAHNQTAFNTVLDHNKVKEEIGSLSVEVEEFSSIGMTPEDVMFMNANTEDGRNYDHNGAPIEASGATTKGKGSGTRFAPPPMSSIQFETWEQHATWEKFIAACNARYDGLTIASRITQFLKEFGRV